MTDYPGVPRTAFRFTSKYVTFGFLEWGLEFLACLPAFVVLLLFLPDGVGYFFVALTGAAAARAGDVLEEPEPLGFGDDVDDDFAAYGRVEVLAFVVGLYVGFSALYSTTVLVAAVGGWAFGVVGGYPTVAIAVAGLLPAFDDLLRSRTGTSIGRLGGLVFGGPAMLILGAYGFSVTPIRTMIRRGRPIP